MTIKIFKLNETYGSNLDHFAYSNSSSHIFSILRQRATDMVDLLTKSGENKIVSACSYPLTGIGCVKRIYTDLATMECTTTLQSLLDKAKEKTDLQAAQAMQKAKADLFALFNKSARKPAIGVG